MGLAETPGVYPMTAPDLRLDLVESADVRGRKTRLRPMRPDEAPRLYAWATDPDVQPFWGGRGHYKSLDDFLENHWLPHYFDGSRPHLGRCFTIESVSARARAGGRPIGMINYNRVVMQSRNTEIDVVIGHPDYRERGYGTDAIRAFLAFLFDDLGLHRVWLATYDYNARARRVYEKLGFVQEGVMRQSDWVDGRWVNGVVYGMLAGELRREDAGA